MKEGEIVAKLLITNRELNKIIQESIIKIDDEIINKIKKEIREDESKHRVALRKCSENSPAEK